MAVPPLGTGGHPPQGDPTHNLAGTVPRNGSDDTVQWPMDPRRHWCAYQRRCGNAGSLVSTHRRATPAGDRPEERRAPTQRTSGHQPKDWQVLPFNTVGDHEFFLDFGDCVFEFARGCSDILSCSRMSFEPQDQVRTQDAVHA